MISVSSVVNYAEFGVDKTAAHKGQRLPIDATGEFAREMSFQKGPGVLGVREGGLDELVVGLVKRILSPRHGADRWKAHAQCQKKEGDDFDKLERRGSTGRWMAESFFWGVSAYALCGYGVTLGSSSSHDPFFSRT